MIVRFSSSSPANIFFLVWAIVLVAPYFFSDYETIRTVSPETYATIIFNGIFFYFCALIFRAAGRSGSVDRVRSAIALINFDKFSRRIRLLFYLWTFIYIVNILGSGGLPIFWLLIGDPRTYVDFGLPTLGGLGNLLRAFVLSGCYLIYSHSKLPRSTKKKFLSYAISLLISAFILETGRGNGVVLILHPIALYLITTRQRIWDFCRWAFAGVVLTILLGAVQAIRYADGFDTLNSYAESSGFSESGYLELLLIPTLMYVVTPAMNVDLNLISAPSFRFEPYYSLQGLVPTVVRDMLFEKGDYGELVSAANNVSSFYLPFVRDFGSFGAPIAVAILSFIVTFWYYKARTGLVFYIISYPPLFMSVALSFFSLFFTSLVVLLYPLLTALVLHECIIGKSRADV